MKTDIDIDDVNLCIKMMNNHIKRLDGLKENEMRKQFTNKQLVKMYVSQIHEVNNIKTQLLKCFPRECLRSDQ